MANSTEYIASDGERWDTIAYKAYGDVNKVNDLIEANPTIPITAILSPELFNELIIVNKTIKSLSFGEMGHL